MSEEDEELSADEMDALLRDLEARASKSEPTPKKEGKKKDVDAFLAESSDAAPAKPTKTKAKPAPKKADLPKQAPIGEIAKSEPEKKKEKPKKEKSVKVVQRGTDDALQKKLHLALLALVIPLAMAAIWALGTYLGPIVSAGWLILLVSLAAILGGALGLRLAIKRGQFSAWTGLVSAIALAGLTAIAPEFAGARMVQYGHWPASAIGQLAGWQADNWFVKLSVSASSLIGEALLPATPVDATKTDRPSPRRLGTKDPLNPPPVVEPTVDPKTPDVKAPDPTATPDVKPDPTATPDPKPTTDPAPTVEPKPDEGKPL